jgi:hypothetical protein
MARFRGVSSLLHPVSAFTLVGLEIEPYSLVCTFLGRYNTVAKVEGPRLEVVR